MSQNIPSTLDEIIENNVNIYRALILESVIGTELLIYLPEITKAERNALRAKHREHGSSKSTEELLDLISGKTDQKGRWTSFINALKHADYEYVSMALEGEDVKDISEQKQIIDVFADNIRKSINPAEILPSLRQKQIINEQDGQEINAELDARGPMAATIVLLDRIPRRKQSWFEDFLDILVEHNRVNLVTAIDDCYLEKHKARMKDAQAMESISSCSSYSTSSSDKASFRTSDLETMEHQVSVYGEGCNTQMNYGAPSQIYDELTKQKNMLEDCIMSSDEEKDADTTAVKIIDEDKIDNKTNDNPYSEILDTSLHSNTFGINDQRISEVENSGVSQDLYLTGLNTTDPVVKRKRLANVTKEIHRELGLDDDRSLPPNIEDDDTQSVISNRIQPMDTDDPESDDNDGLAAPEKENLELRDYQNELAKPGLNGQNCIVVAPTGSGKTHVALKIIQEHMKRVRGKRVAKVIFLVEQSALAQQQGKMCKKFLDCKVKTITGEVQQRENYKELSEWLQRRDILVVTAQLLVNALVNGDVEITQFSLLVFDECHHTNLKHPFNRIMHYYLDMKLDENVKHKALPQVIGLTASVGVGKADTKVAAVNWIQKIMAHLDAQELATVRRQKHQLAEFVTVPEQTTVTVEKRKNNIFEEAVNNLLAAIETFMVKKKYANVVAEFGKTLHPPSGRGSQQYTQWLSTLWKETAKIYDQDARRHFTTCRNYLECYNNALIIYFDARVKDALAYLEQEVSRINETAIQDETDKVMEKIYHKSKDVIESCLCEGNENPKLVSLKELLIQTYTEEPDSRGIVFVKTRDLGKAIEAWMKETPELRDLKPKTFFGAQASIDKGGMTKNQQEDALTYFRDGKHRVIIATSVAEEGLDIQKCNLVIRYDHVTNEIAMVQSRGRGRAEDSKYVLVAETASKAVEKEELNLLRESMMQDAILNVQDKIESDRHAFRNRILNQQKEEKILRDMEMRNRKGRQMQEGQFELRCHKCSNFICMSSDIKKIMDAHHAIMSTDIGERIIVRKASRPQFVDKQLQAGVARVTCRNCGMDLGNVSIYKGAQFPIMKIMSFVIVDSYGNKDVVKKWKQAPFIVSPLSIVDLQKRVESSFQLLTL